MYSIMTALCARRASLAFAFGRLGVTTTHVFGLAHAGRRVLIGQNACQFLAFAREAIDSTRAVCATSKHQQQLLTLREGGGATKGRRKKKFTLLHLAQD